MIGLIYISKNLKLVFHLIDYHLMGFKSDNTSRHIHEAKIRLFLYTCKYDKHGCRNWCYFNEYKYEYTYGPLQLDFTIECVNSESRT